LRSVCVSRRQDCAEELLPEEPDMTGELSATMTLREFENGYWYRKQLKDFAQRIGIPAAAELRKDELA